MPQFLCIRCGVVLYGHTSMVIPCAWCSGPLTPIPDGASV